MEGVWVGQCASPCILSSHAHCTHSVPACIVKLRSGMVSQGLLYPPFCVGWVNIQEQRGFLSHEDLRLLDRGQEYEIAYFSTWYNFAKCRRVSQVVILTV